MAAAATSPSAMMVGSSRKGTSMGRAFFCVASMMDTSRKEDRYATLLCSGHSAPTS